MEKIKASCTNNMHIGKNIFAATTFERFVSRLFSGRVKKNLYYTLALF